MKRVGKGRLVPQRTTTMGFRQAYTSTTSSARSTLISSTAQVTKRYLSGSCSNCRYYQGCLAVEREAMQAERSRLMVYLLAGSLVPIAFVSATQDWSKVAGAIRGIRFGSTTYESNKRERQWQDVDLAVVPDMVPVPLVQSRQCGCGCGKDAVSAGNYEVAGGMLWIKQHFHCSDCSKPLVGKMRTTPLANNAGDETWVFYKGGKLFCADHYTARFCNDCSHCRHHLNGDFLLDPKTGNASCVPCYDSLGEKAFSSSHLLNEEEGKHLFVEVKEGLSDLLGLDFGKGQDSPLRSIPLSVVDAKEMMRTKNTATFSKSSTLSYGLTVKTRSKDAKDNNQAFDVKNVLVLNGMNRLKTGGVLAHELMHCWLAVNVLKGKEKDDLLPLEVEEGLCELVAYLWLLNEKQKTTPTTTTTTTTSGVGMEEVLVELMRMENNDEKQQGLSFHQAFHALQQGRTLKQLLQFVVKEGRFPTAKDSITA